MKSTITNCPHLDPDQLSEMAEKALEPLHKEIDSIITSLKQISPEVAAKVNRLDDLYLAAINAVQNATILNIVCHPCDTMTECHAE